jgi:hypothetical protein
MDRVVHITQYGDSKKCRAETKDVHSSINMEVVPVLHPVKKEQFQQPTEVPEQLIRKNYQCLLGSSFMHISEKVARR